MNFDDIFSTDNTGVSPEKLAFFKAMAGKQANGSAQDMLASLMSISNAAQKQGVSLTEKERDIMLNVLVNTLPPSEKVKAQNMIRMMQRMKR